MKISDINLRLATKNDKQTIKKVMAESFKYDPCIMWLTEQTSRKDKVEVIVDYMIDETFEDGSIYITQDNSAIALWKTEKKEKITWGFIKRNLSFLFKMGIRCVVRNLKNKANIERHFPKNQKFCYLYAIGVMPESQGKGLASKLMNPVIEASKKLNLPLFLETANIKNVKIYQKKGFVITDTLSHNLTTISYMKLC
jgi:ribosomal protein S18 acetylase RimI-like enzyme